MLAGDTTRTSLDHARELLDASRLTTTTPMRQQEAGHMTTDENLGKAAIFDLDGTLLDSMGVWDQIDAVPGETRHHRARRLHGDRHGDAVP